MDTLCRAYESTYDAENAIERLLSADVPAIRIGLIMGHAVEDARDAAIGTFAGTTTADAQIVGSYANVAHSGREAIGAFAGDADRQRRGSFGDVDRDTVTTYQSGGKRTRIASHHRLEKIVFDPNWTRRPPRPMWLRCMQDASSCWSKARRRWTTSRPCSTNGTTSELLRDRQRTDRARRDTGEPGRSSSTHVFERNSPCNSLAIDSSALDRPPASR